MAVSNALKPIIDGLPSFPIVSGVPLSAGIDGVIRVRNVLQEWLIAVLLFPGARESPAIRQFMTYGANQMPVQFEGVSWLSFENPPRGGGSSRKSSHARSARNDNLDEMEMDDMFDGGSYDSEDDHGDLSDEDEEVLPYSQRYPPPDEAVTQEDVDLLEDGFGEVEMVEDVGSLAQSLGASHLGRSLPLQQQMERANPANQAARISQQQGITVGGVGTNVGGDAAAGGIGTAVKQDIDRIPGLGDSFNHKPPISAARLDSFKMIKVIGKGSFGKVFLVKEIKTGEMFALKVLRKDNIIKRNQVEHTRTERSVLGYVRHPFIVSMNMAFQSKDKLYFVLDYCAGGELFFHLGKLGKFPEPRARFYAAEITLAINYVHQLDIIYRDLKPENVLLDAKGHVRLTDFGLSKEGISSSSTGANSFCGTPEYLSPEILNRQGHGRAVDWWSLGALLYEMLTGLPPFYCRDRERLFEKIRKSELTYPRYLSASAQSILRGLLTRDPTKRLGSGPTDADEIRNHSFFLEINWNKLARGEVTPPFVPKIKNSLDTSQFDHEFTSMPMMTPESFKQSHGFGKTPTDNPFEGFTFTENRFHHPEMANN